MVDLEGMESSSTGKQRLIKYIESLPDCIDVKITREVPRPSETCYLMGYKGRPTDIVSHSIEKHSVTISIDFEQ